MPGPYRWEGSKGRFLDGMGRTISRINVRLELDRVLRNLGDEAVGRSADLREGRITQAEWRVVMRDIIKESHLDSTAAARGGWVQLNQADYGRVGQILAHGPKGGLGEYEYLDRLAAEIDAGLPLDGRFLQRTRMYVEAGRSTYHNFDSRWHEERGFTEERNIRHADDSCDICVEVTDLDWVTLGTLPPIGSRTCLRNCRCTLEYRKVARRQAA